MKRFLVTAGGTATAWHISQVATQYFKDSIEIEVSDINDPYLVPTTVSAKKVHKVPPVVADNYKDVIAGIIKDNGIDAIIPLIPQEAFLFASDSDFIRENNILSSAASLKTTELLADKYYMFKTLSSLDIPTPYVYDRSELTSDGIYLAKPRLGFGSAGVKVIKSGDEVSEDTVIQEYCHDDDYDEVTVEVFNGDELKIFSRRRIATKAGVCVKMEPVDNNIFYPYIKKLVDNVDCPRAFNVQFLYNKGEWKLFDCNLRLGAGTALSSAIGFQLTRAFLASLAGLEVDNDWLKPDDSVKAVLRVYQEIVVR